MRQKNPTVYPYPASEVNFLQNLPLTSVSTVHPQLNAQELVRLLESSMTPRATGTLPLPSSGPTCCSWTRPYPLLGHHPTFLRSLLLSCLKATLLHQDPQTVQPTQPNPTPADPSRPSFSIPLYYLFFLIALLWSGIKLHISFLSSIPITPPHACTRM